MLKSNSALAAIRGECNHKFATATHWQRQASISTRLQRGDTLRIDNATLEPWRQVAAVLGVSVSECVEQELLGLGGPTDIACNLEDVIKKRLYFTREEAERVAERFELWAVAARLNGEQDIPVSVADVVPVGEARWGITTDVLGPNGWLSESAQDGEEW